MRKEELKEAFSLALGAVGEVLGEELAVEEEEEVKEELPMLIADEAEDLWREEIEE